MAPINEKKDNETKISISRVVPALRKLYIPSTLRYTVPEYILGASTFFIKIPHGKLYFTGVREVH